MCVSDRKKILIMEKSERYKGKEKMKGKEKGKMKGIVWY